MTPVKRILSLKNIRRTNLKIVVISLFNQRSAAFASEEVTGIAVSTSNCEIAKQLLNSSLVLVSSKPTQTIAIILFNSFLAFVIICKILISKTFR